MPQVNEVSWFFNTSLILMLFFSMILMLNLTFSPSLGSLLKSAHFMFVYVNLV